jgi:hypothetical protein
LYTTLSFTNYGYATEAAAILALKARRIPYEMELDGGVLRTENIIARAVKRLLVGGAARYWSTVRQTDRFLKRLACQRRGSFAIRFSSIYDREILSRPLTKAEKQSAKRNSIFYRRMVLSVGRALHLKGFDLLIRAAARLPETRGLHRRRSAEDECSPRQRGWLRPVPFRSTRQKNGSGVLPRGGCVCARNARGRLGPSGPTRQWQTPCR